MATVLNLHHRILPKHLILSLMLLINAYCHHEPMLLLQESIDVGFKAKIEGTPTLIFIDTKTGKTLMTGGGDLKFLEEQFKQLKE